MRRLKGVEVSKKDKSKFRKHIKAQILQEMQKSQKEMPQPSPQSSSEVTPAAIATAATGDSALQNLPQIKYDLKKTGLVVGSLVLILAVLYLLDLKYNILLSFGDVIFRVLHIQ